MTAGAGLTEAQSTDWHVRTAVGDGSAGNGVAAVSASFSSPRPGDRDGWTGDGGPPVSAEFANPDGVTAVSQEERATGSAIYVIDVANSRIRLVYWEGGGAG